MKLFKTLKNMTNTCSGLIIDFTIAFKTIPSPSEHYFDQ